MVKYEIKRKIVNCEKIESVTSHDLDLLPLSQTVTPSQTPPFCSVTYFMEGPLDDDRKMILFLFLWYFESPSSNMLLIFHLYDTVTSCHDATNLIYLCQLVDVLES